MKTLGATSYVYVTLDALNERLKGTQEIPINRKFAEMLKLEGRQAATTSASLKQSVLPPPEINNVELEEVEA